MPFDFPIHRRNRIAAKLPSFSSPARHAALASQGTIPNADQPQRADMISARRLAEALRSLDNPVCTEAASALMSQARDGAGVSLHVRNADLLPSSAATIADALQSPPADGGAVLRSFSVSYNRGLGDAGVAKLVNALPPGVQELGFIDCAIGDVGAQGSRATCWIGPVSRPLRPTAARSR